MAPGSHVVEITYCTQCNWLLRSAWMIQEILNTFDGQIKQAILSPGTGGIFTITLDGKRLWDRVDDGGFPGAKEIKQRIRDVIDPERDLGHVDR